MINAIETILWPGLRALEPKESELGGILADKRGYHNTRDRLLREGHTSDYSIQTDKDKKGPGSEGSAIDWTFRNAQAGNFSTINKYSKRLYAAGVNDDPRAKTYLREFFGNTDIDRTVEGWSYFHDAPATSADNTHLWHIHLSIYRQYINDTAAMQAIIDICAGKAIPPHPTPSTGGKLPVHVNGSRELSLKVAQMTGTDVQFVQKWIGSRCGTADGSFGAKTKSGVIWYQSMRGLKADGVVGPHTWDALGY